jgi:Flp pilus assembly protein TadD
MAPNQDNTPPTLWKIVGIRPLWVVIAFVSVILIFFTSRWGSQKYNQSQQVHLLKQAQEFEAKGDFRSAIVTIRRVLQLNPNNLEAVRMLALQAERFNSPVALQWMRRLVELEPGNQTNIILWAKCAIRQGELMVADQILVRIPEKQRQTLEFHRVAGLLAIQMRQYPAAEFHFAKAQLLAPDSKQDRLNLVSIRLLSAKPEVVQNSLAALEQFLADPQLDLEAGRSLLSYYQQRNDTAKQVELSKKVYQLPRARFSDYLTYIQILHNTGSKQFDSELARARALALQKKESIAEMLAWMNARDMAKEAYEWIATLPKEIQQQPAIMLVMAENLTILKKWPELQKLTAKSDWQEMEFLRLAFLARAQREQDMWGLSRAAWRQALTTVGLDNQNRTLLAKMVQSWGWSSEAEEIWLALARNQQGQLGALRALHKLYLSTGDTRRLLKVTEQIYQLMPEDPVIKNNYASLSFLLGHNLSKARELALSNFKAAPKDPVAMATYALSLREDGKLKEAIDLMEQLPANAKKNPTLAAYLGIFLAEAGQKKAAKPYLDLGLQAQGLLPEERELLNAANRKISQ